MSITTKIIAPIWLLGLSLAALAIFIELATLGPTFGELGLRNSSTLARAVDAAVASADTPQELDRALQVLARESSVRTMDVAGGDPVQVLASTNEAYRRQPIAALPPALRDRLIEAANTKQRSSWTDRDADTFGLAGPLDVPVGFGPRNGVAAVVTDHSAVTAAVRSLIWIGIRRKLILILSVTVIALITVRTFVVRPLRAIHGTAERQRAGDTHARAPQGADDELGQLASVLNHALDARAASEHRLVEALERVERAARGGDAGLWDWRIGSPEVYYSSHFKALLGEDDAGLPDTAEALRARMHPDDVPLRKAALQAHLEGQGPFDVTVRVRHRNGEYRWFRETGQLVRDESGTPQRVSGAFADVTARMRLEAELRAAKDAAEHAVRMKSAFLATMSHEIRTPMNGVLGMADLLMSTPLTQEQRENTEMIRRSGDALLRIIDDVLDVSKIEAGKLTLESARFDLDGAVDDVVELLTEKARARNVRVTAVMPPDVPQFVTGDVTRVRQILVNLVGNAVKFTENGDITVKARVVSRDAGSLLLRFDVEDTGIGIPNDIVPRLFEPFVQADSSTTRRFCGTGRGLAISKRLAEQMGGEIGVESTVGRGSTFWFTVRQGIAEASSEPPPLRGMRTLVLADHGPTREALAARLIRLGASVQSMSAEIMPHADRGRYDAVIVEDGTRAAMALGGSYADGGRATPILFRHAAAGPEAADGLFDSLRSGIEVLTGIKSSHITRAVAPAISLLAPAAVTESSAGLTPNCAAARILVVEDNRTNQKVAQKMLEGFGYAVDLQANGQLGVEAHAAEPYDLILMDCQMPVMDGYEASRAIRALKSGAREVPIIALTANALEGDRERCLAAGMNDYLTKPLKRERLRAALEQWLRTAQREAATLS
jgi:signal transduction histidine kinase/ActR/RegA family two-component response regulator